MTHAGKCEARDAVAPEAICSHSDWRVLWVPTGPELHGVKMAPMTYVGRYSCTTHEDLYWTAVARNLGRGRPKLPLATEAKPVKEEPITLF